MLHKVRDSIADSALFQEKPGPLGMPAGTAGKAGNEMAGMPNCTAGSRLQKVTQPVGELRGSGAPPALQPSCLRRQRLIAGCCARCRRP